ncbi:hypothetical protein EC973_006379 [Apophysomyces ossiformis]|uniref:GAR domain-containing protein n=1 Tax=Apophysomyces ossiformis TaxID=679940 RepID=A0A8H7EUI2_9FUNG|nr:hypothetical protein EC973_006379 [Apophysomyces ossiformis]
MSANLDVETLPTDPNSKLRSLNHAPSTYDRSFAEPPSTPPPYNLSSECRNLREQTLLNWVNCHIEQHIETFDQLASQKTVLDLIDKLPGPKAPLTDEENHMQNNTMVTKVEQWVGHKLPLSLDDHHIDQNQMISLICYILTHYQAHIICTLQEDPTAYIRKNIPYISIPKNTTIKPTDIQQILLTWAQEILADYIHASILPPIHDCAESWQDGLYFLALVHFHCSTLIPDLDDLFYDRSRNQWHDTLTTAFQLAYNKLDVPMLLEPDTLVEADTVDEESIMLYLIEFIQAVSHINPFEEENRQKRQRDIDRWKQARMSPDSDPADTPSLSSAASDGEPSGTSTMRTSTYTLQQLRITKTTTTKSGETSRDVPEDLEEFESQAVAILEKIAALHNRLDLIVPTRSSNYNSMPTSATSDIPPELISDDGEASTRSTEGDQAKMLHPLRAAEEDLRVYDTNFRALQSALQSLASEDLTTFHQYVQKLDTERRDHPKVLTRMTQIEHAHSALVNAMEKGDRQLAVFRRGFSFAQECGMVRSGLDLIQTNMVKSTTTDTDIQDLERRVEKTTALIETIKSNFTDLLEPDDDMVSAGETKDDAYAARLEKLIQKNELVRSWVEEVRIWFAEAERIRQWIEIRLKQLGETTIPEALNCVEPPLTREEVDQLNAAHDMLKKEIEMFGKEDMGRLRSHVKALTGADRMDKDLSPADTTTIEITLTTLTTLDNLMHSLHRKSYDLQVLTGRVAWEEEYKKTMDWIYATDLEVEEFLQTTARWQVGEDDNDTVDNREAKEKLQELVIQKLLTLEHKLADFDKTQYTTTVDLFQDLDNTSEVELPEMLESRQNRCEQLFEDLLNRVAFARQVVQQRLSMMDFLNKTGALKVEGGQLLDELKEAAVEVGPDDNDRDMIARVQGMHERMVQLVTSTASQIPFPDTLASKDKDENEKSNQAIRDVIGQKRMELVLLGEDLDRRLNELKNILHLHRRARQLVGEASRLSEWADTRSRSLRQARVDISTDTNTITIEELMRLERDQETLLGRLKNGKEDEVVDLVTKIQELVDNVQKLEASSINASAIKEASQDLMEKFDQLLKSLEEHGLDLKALRKRLEDGNTYLENANALRAFIYDTRASMPGLKHTCGFMTGQSEEQDRQRYETLYNTVNELHAAYKDRAKQFDALCAHVKLITSDDVDDMEEATQVQKELDQNWAQLTDEMKDLTSFAEAVKAWYDRQRRLSVVENSILSGLNEDIAHLAESGWTDTDLERIEARVKEAFDILNETGRELAQADTKEDPLQTANYSCARDRHSVLMNKAQAAFANLNMLKKNANKALAFSVYLGQANVLLADVESQKEKINRRMTAAGESDFASKDMHAMERLFRETQAASSASETESQKLRQRLRGVWEEAKQLQIQGYDSRSVEEPAERIEKALEHLRDVIALEKRQAGFVRKAQIHAKAAGDLHTWINHCSNAITQLPTDVCVSDETELRAEVEALERKLLDIQPTVQAFQAMEARIFSGKDGEPIDLREICLDTDQTKNAVKTREVKVLAEWADLSRQLELVKQSIETSRRGVEIARKIKEIVMLVGDLKDRVGNVRVCSALAQDDPAKADGRDLKFILTCPLTMLPTERETAVAKAELGILERDIEQRLQPTVADLDVMLKSNIENEEIFAGQRAEIAEAMRNLTDLVKAKRDAIAEAQKMEGFLIVTEELEVLLSALSEVIDRASPEYARIVDGVRSRADLQAMLIDLDTRYRYYEPKINELMEEAEEVSQKLKSDKRVVDSLQALADKWAQLKAQAAAKKADLLARIGPLSDQFGSFNPSTNLHERGQRAAKRQSAPPLGRAPKPQPMQSTPRLMGKTTPSPGRRTTTGHASPTARRVAVRNMFAQAQRTKAKTPEAYVADPQNDLDVALGHIVNDSPYKVRVKMVPGEVGKYWFGDVNPKLAYCRILRSRMVMVRVGGGWVELSQFLRDHALLEGGNFVPRAPDQAKDGAIQEAFLRTGRVNAHQNGMVTIRGGGGASPGPLRESRSTPYHRGISPIPYGHGVKEGNKFLVTVDNEGNRVEVKMTKAKIKDTKFITPRRTQL